MLCFPYEHRLFVQYIYWLNKNVSLLTTHSKNCLLNALMKPVEITISFNVKSLFTNIPVSFTSKLIITDALYQNGKFLNSNALFNGFNLETIFRVGYYKWYVFV